MSERVQVLREIERRIAAHVDDALAGIPKLKNRVASGIGTDERPGLPREACMVYVGFTRSDTTRTEYATLERIGIDVRLEMMGLKNNDLIKEASDAVVAGVDREYVGHRWAKEIEFTGRQELGFASKDGAWLYNHSFVVPWLWRDGAVPAFRCKCREAFDGDVAVRFGLWRSLSPIDPPTALFEREISITP